MYGTDYVYILSRWPISDFLTHPNPEASLTPQWLYMDVECSMSSHEGIQDVEEPFEGGISVARMPRNDGKDGSRVKYIVAFIIGGSVLDIRKFAVVAFLMI
jgi:hypothetical protein